MRPWRLAVATAMFALSASIAQAFEGRVVDGRTGRPIAGAQLAIVGVSGTARTDLDGRFSWTPDPRLPCTAVIVMPGGLVARVVIEQIAPAGILLIEVDPAVAEELTVTGVAPGIDSAPGSARTVVSASDVARRAPLNLMQALEDVPGVSSVAEGQSGVPAVRGLARGRTLILIDGGRIFSERRAGPSVSFLAPESIDRIDVARGPASVAYGSDALGGVIAIRTREPRLGAPFDARVSGMAGAGVPVRRLDAVVSVPIRARGAVMLHGRAREAPDYSSPDGPVPNSAWSDSGGLLRASANIGDGLWTAGWQGDFVGDSGRPRSDSAAIRLTAPFERTQRGALSFNRGGVAAIGQLSVSAFVSGYRQRIDQDRLATARTTRRIDRADIEGRDFQLRATAQRAVGPGRLLAGMDVNGRRGLEAHDTTVNFDSAGTVTTVADNVSVANARKTDTGVFAQVDVPVAAALTLSAGGRATSVRSINEGGYFGNRTVAHRAASGLVALTAQPRASWTLTVQLARGFRDPTLSDRFYRGPVGRGFIVGNPDLEPETSLQADLSVRYASRRFRLGLSAYHYRIARLIERYQSGADTFLFKNRGLARVRGIELEVGADLTSRVAVALHGQVGQGRNTDDATGLDDIAPPSLAVQVRATIGRGVTAVARVATVARDRIPGPTEVPAPGYADAGAGIGWTIGRRIEVRASGTNLLNQRYYSSPGPRWVLAPGASGVLTVTIGY